LTNQSDADKGPLHNNVNRERQQRREQCFSEPIHEFTDAVTAVIRYSELTLPEIERSHPAPGVVGKNQGSHSAACDFGSRADRFE